MRHGIGYPLTVRDNTPDISTENPDRNVIIVVVKSIKRKRNA